MKLKELFTAVIEHLEHADVFFGHAVGCAEDEAVLLMMHVMDMGFEQLNASADRDLHAEQINRANNLLHERISTRKPLAYLLGFVFFAGLRFQVDERALVPRSPMAELIVNDLDSMTPLECALDLCTGSGCIGLALAHHHPQLHVDLVDIDAEALALAEINRQQLDLTDRTRILQSDLFTHVEGSYDLILTNPPYVSRDEYLALPEEYHIEPELGLVTEMNGMLIPVKILAEAANYLNDNGLLYLEVGYSDQILMDILPDVDFEWLEFAQGGQGICIFNRQDLIRYRPLFERLLATHV
ncbi:50S ribosomal protein L3 N(5)-glutamine methyltransferase [Marinicella sp. W31]|uniref:50S ribosomal protein L3 N(5)-glutamine methyltransferase n=1 Tax=Marinicella sp. W31 TaxID=3023713 RepID=UPI0037565FD6